jgi:4-hydroxy-2-oxoheptanedioate aldolase
MTSSSHRLRRALRAAIAGDGPVVGTFVKLPTPDVVELAGAAGFAFVVVDLEHSALSEPDAIGLVRHADRCGLPSVVRIPRVDAALVNRLLENGATGMQLSMLRTVAQARELRAAARFAPEGARSISMANRVAEFGAPGVTAFLRAEAEDPPLLIGQIETASTEPFDDLLPGLDVCFVGTTDLSVDLGVSAGAAELRSAVADIASAARSTGVAFGGWAPSVAAAPRLGLDAADYLVVGSDVQILAAGLRAAARPEDDKS